MKRFPSDLFLKDTYLSLHSKKRNSYSSQSSGKVCITFSTQESKHFYKAMNSLIKFLAKISFVLQFVIISTNSYEPPKPSHLALKCLIQVYRQQEFIDCGSRVSAKWGLTDEGGHDVRQKCCSIFELWDCIDVLSERNCTKPEYRDVKQFKHNLIDRANKNECTAFNYLSDECNEEEIDNVVT